MDIKCGVDIIEVDRIKEAIEKHKEKFLNRIFTNKEIEYCSEKNKMKYQHFAARYAAKEAIFKAISECFENKYNVIWTDIEILNDKNGRPFVRFYNEKLKDVKIDISLSHIKDYAIANCICYFDN